MRGRSDPEPALLMISGLRQPKGEAARRAVPAHAAEGRSSKHSETEVKCVRRRQEPRRRCWPSCQRLRDEIRGRVGQPPAPPARGTLRDAPDCATDRRKHLPICLTASLSPSPLRSSWRSALAAGPRRPTCPLATAGSSPPASSSWATTGFRSASSRETASSWRGPASTCASSRLPSPNPSCLPKRPPSGGASPAPRRTSMRTARSTCTSTTRACTSSMRSSSQWKDCGRRRST